MPTYEYRCAACENEWEAEQSIKDDPLTTCPKCNAEAAKRQISAGTGFIFKGGGGSSGVSTTAPRPVPASGNASLERAMHDRFEKVSGIKLGGDDK